MCARSNAYTMPFLFATETSLRPPESVNSVGVVPQSESTTASDVGSCQVLACCSVSASSATIACDSVCDTSSSVPVDTITEFVAAS